MKDSKAYKRYVELLRSLPALEGKDDETDLDAAHDEMDGLWQDMGKKERDKSGKVAQEINETLKKHG